MTTQPISAAQYANLAVVLGVVEQDHELARMWAQIPARVRTAKGRAAQQASAAQLLYDGPLPVDLPEPQWLHGCGQAVCAAVEFCRDCGRGMALRQGQREKAAKREAKRGGRDGKAAAGGDDAE
jgi:hypothetical protein